MRGPRLNAVHHEIGAHMTRSRLLVVVLTGFLVTFFVAACSSGGTTPPEGGGGGGGGGGGKVTAAAAGQYHSLALLDDGTVLGWGLNSDGQTGDANSTKPRLVTGLTDIVAIAAGRSHSLALAADGTVYAMGSNSEGQLGRTGNNSAVPVTPAIGANIVAIAAANDTSFALDDEGGLWAWGGNDRYGLGDGTTTSRTAPAKVAGLPAVSSFGAHHSVVFAVTESDGVWAWGLGNAGMLGTNNTDHQPAPVRVTSLDAYDVVKVAPGSAYAVALLADGTLLGWGTNQSGQLGRPAGAPTTIMNPAPIPDLSGVDFLTSGPNTVALVVDGHPVTFGSNVNGALGASLGQVRKGEPSTLDLDGVVSLAMSHGGQQTAVLAVHADGTLSGWGWNAYDQVGTGETTDEYNAPQTVREP